MPDPATRRVLVLRPGAIGDTLLTYPALLALRTHFPAAVLHLVGNPVAAPLLAAQRGAAGRPLVDELTPFDAASVTGLFLAGGPSEAARIAFAPVEAAVAWCADPDGLLATNLGRLGAESVVIAPSRPAPRTGVHVSDHLVLVLTPLGLAPDLSLPAPSRGVPTLGVAPNWSNAAGDVLRRLGLADRPIVLVHPGSGSASKNWPIERFAAVLERLPDAIGSVGVVVSGPAEGELIVRLRTATRSTVPILSDLPLTTMADVIHRARAYLGNDSGLTHLAGLLGIPTLALFGPTDPALWAPLGPRVRVLRHHPLDTLSVDEVLAALVRLAR